MHRSQGVAVLCQVLCQLVPPLLRPGGLPADVEVDVALRDVYLLRLRDLRQDQLDLYPVRRGLPGALDELLLVLLELLGGDAAAHVLLDELAQDALRLGLNEAVRGLEARLVRERLGHLASLGGSVPLLLLELQARAHLAPEALEVVHPVGLEERRVELREDALADLQDLERVACGLARERRHRLEIRWKRDRDRLLLTLRNAGQLLAEPGDDPLVRALDLLPRLRDLGVKLLVAGNLRHRPAVQGSLIRQFDVVALARGPLRRLEVRPLGAQRLDDALNLGVRGVG